MLVKVCGMCHADNIRDVEGLGIDFMGFIFFPRSPRYVSDVPEYMPSKCKRVGVFVNESTENILATAERFSLDFLQLHGSETPEQCAALRAVGYKIIKVFSVAESEDIEKTADYQSICDYVLFDTSCAGYGGSGRSFNWEILSEYTGDVPFLLSGGLSLENMALLKEFSHPKLAGVDLNSGFEFEPALKNTAALRTFISNICDYE